MVAAATEDNHYRQNYYPGAVVIVKNVAQAIIVVHMFPPRS